MIEDKEDGNDFRMKLHNEGDAANELLKTNLVATLTFTSIGAFRLSIAEDGPESEERYRLNNNDVMTGFDALSVPLSHLVKIVKTAETAHLSFNESSNRIDIEVNYKPFRLSIKYNGSLHSVVNHQNLFNFELSRSDQPKNHTMDATAFDDRDLWSYYFGGETDNIKQGPRAIGLDISYCDGK